MAVMALIVFVLDRATKLLVVEALGLKHVFLIDVYPPYLRLVMAWNRGINFGIGGSDSDAVRWFLVALALAISAGLAIWSLRTAGWRVPLAVGCVVGGALGNVWDRVQYGAVADFLNMSCCGIDNPYAFNVADVAIFVGAAGLILFSGRTDKGA